MVGGFSLVALEQTYFSFEAAVPLCKYTRTVSTKWQSSVAFGPTYHTLLLIHIVNPAPPEPGYTSEAVITNRRIYENCAQVVFQPTVTISPRRVFLQFTDLGRR